MSTTGSQTVATYPIITALVKAEEILGPTRNWNPSNEDQRRFLTEFFNVCRGEGLTIPEIESIASWNVNDINTFLDQRGFTIRLSPFDTDTFGVASVLDLLVEWLEEGEETTVKDKLSKSYPAVRLTSGVEFRRSFRHRHPIVKIATKSGDIVYMTVVDDAQENFDLVAQAQMLSQTSHVSSEFDGLVFPMVDLKQEIDLSWLIGMYTHNQQGRFAYISQAVQQNSLQLTPKGGRARSAFAAGISLEITLREPDPDMIIDAPFLCWFDRAGLTMPLFTGRITQKDWKNPESIS